MARKSFSIHSDFYDELLNLDDKQFSELLRLLIIWAKDDITPQGNGVINMLFRLMTAQIVRISEVNRQNGLKPKSAKSELSELSGESEESELSELSEGSLPFPNPKAKTDSTKEVYTEIINLFNSICVSFAKVQRLSDSRQREIKARLKSYSLDDFKTLFTLAESSDFLKGKNDRNWIATFDFIITDKNMARVLDGNFNNNKPHEYQYANGMSGDKDGDSL